MPRFLRRLLLRLSGWAARYGGGYAAARPGRLDDGKWWGMSQDINALIMGNNRVLRERVRGMVRNYPPFTQAIKAHSAFVVGKGARFQSLAAPPGMSAKKTAALRNFIELNFRQWMKSCDISGKWHFYQICLMVVRQRMETGEFFCHLDFDKKSQNLTLQLIEPDRVEGGLEVTPQVKDHLVYQGIELDPMSGQPQAYHVLKQTYPGFYNYDHTRIPAGEMLHSFDWLRPGQVRGITDFAPVILLADSMDDYMTAELDAAKMAAKWMAMVKTPDIPAFQSARPPFGKTADQPKRIEQMENALIEYLNPGEDITFAAPSRVGDGFDRYTRFVLRMISIIASVPYEVLSGDYTQINYSTSRASRNDLVTMLYPQRFWLQESFMDKVFSAWLKVAALKYSELAGYFEAPEAYEQALWIPAGQLSIDPLREGKADIDAMAAGLRSPQQVILAGGGDPEQTMREIIDWKSWADAAGISFNLSGISTAMAGNPDAIGATENLEIENIGGSE
jgi:lambda family phage portal protein